MKRLISILTLFIAPIAFSQSLGGGLFGPPSYPRFSTFANLSTPIAGHFRYCTDCTATAPCAGSGTGAFAFRVGSAWNCSNGSSGTGLTFLAGDGTAAAPAYSFASTGNGDNGMYLFAANAIGLSTAGTARWAINASGALVAATDGGVDIGNGASDPRDLSLQRNLILRGSTSGTTTVSSGAIAGSSVLTLPVATDTLVGKATTDEFTNKTFKAGTGTAAYYPCGIITADVTSATTTGTIEETLWTYTLPGNTLTTDGSFIRVHITAQFAANANTKALKLYFGTVGTAVNATTTAPNGSALTGAMIVYRLGAASQIVRRSTMVVGAVVQGVTSPLSTTETLTGDVTVRITATDATAAGDSTLQEVVVEYCRA